MTEAPFRPGSRLLLLALLASSVGCRSVARDPAEASPAATASPAAMPAPSGTPPLPPQGTAAPRGEPGAFGAPLDATLAPTPLARIVADPTAFRDQRVRTGGTVAQVCQRMGCWMELRDGDGPAVRVPMAGHAFFLPRDAAGRAAELEGTVRLSELPAAMREHLEAEGARETSSQLSIEATGVVLR